MLPKRMFTYVNEILVCIMTKHNLGKCTSTLKNNRLKVFSLYFAPSYMLCTLIKKNYYE